MNRLAWFLFALVGCGAQFGAKEEGVTHLRGVGNVTGGCQHKFFVYKLPAKWNDMPEDPKDKGLEHAFGQPIAGLNHVFTTSPLAIGEIISYRLLNSKCRTEDATEAEAFYVPILPKAKRLADWKKVCDDLSEDSLDELEKALVHLTDANKGKHFIVYSQAAHHTNALPECIAWANSELLDGMTKLSVDDHDWPYAAWFHPIPYPSMVHCSEIDDKKKCPWQTASMDRPVQVSFVTGEEHLDGPLYDANDGSKLDGITRQDLVDWCNKKPDHVCTAIVIPKTAKVKDLKDDALHKRTAEIAKLMSNSVYCMQPPADYSYAKRGLMDSVLLGCIPVIFTRKQLNLMPWHWAMPKSVKMALLLSSFKYKWQLGELVNFKTYEKLILSQQQEIRANGHLLQYAPHGSPRADADALSVILDHVSDATDYRRLLSDDRPKHEAYTVDFSRLPADP